jgi:hypothetical protein
VSLVLVSFVTIVFHKSPSRCSQNLHKLIKGEHILGLTHVHFEKDRVCSACQAGKQVGTHHPHKNIMTTDRPLELLHMDLFGPIAYIRARLTKLQLLLL